jgi:hypothetical protein
MIIPHIIESQRCYGLQSIIHLSSLKITMQDGCQPFWMTDTLYGECFSVTAEGLSRESKVMHGQG